MRLLLALFCLFAQPVHAMLPKVSAGTLVRLEQFASALIAARHVDVWLPDGYPKAAPYAVLYMHDGQMLFDGTQTWNGQEWRADEVASELIRSGKTRPFIIVGIANGGAARHSEYFPQRAFALLSADDQARMATLKRGDEALFARPVDSDAYLKFLVTELKPHIDAHYAVDPAPSSTVIMGSSMGGLISMYALAEYPGVFGAAACLSSHWAGTVTADDVPVQEALLSWVATYFANAGAQRIYMDRGTETIDVWYPALQDRVDQLLRDKGYGPRHMLSLVFPGADHSEKAWAARLHIPMQFLLPPVDAQ